MLHCAHDHQSVLDHFARDRCYISCNIYAKLYNSNIYTKHEQLYHLYMMNFLDKYVVYNVNLYQMYTFLMK